MHVTSQASSLRVPYGHKLPPKYSVHWGQIDVYCHEPELGDNPAVSSGPPMTISWSAHSHYSLPVDAFEEERAHSRSPDRLLAASRSARETKLLNAGYTRRELEQASLEVAVISNNRVKSSHDGRLRAKFHKWAHRTFFGERQR